MKAWTARRTLLGKSDARAEVGVQRDDGISVHTQIISICTHHAVENIFSTSSYVKKEGNKDQTLRQHDNTSMTQTLCLFLFIYSVPSRDMFNVEKLENMVNDLEFRQFDKQSAYISQKAMSTRQKAAEYLENAEEEKGTLLLESPSPEPETHAIGEDDAGAMDVKRDNVTQPARPSPADAVRKEVELLPQDPSPSPQSISIDAALKEAESVEVIHRPGQHLWNFCQNIRLESCWSGVIHWFSTNASPYLA